MAIPRFNTYKRLSLIHISIENAKVKIEDLQAQQVAASMPNRGQSSATGNAIVDFAYVFIRCV